MRPTTEIYEKIAAALLSQKVKPTEAYEVLESSGFQVKLDGELYTGVYASRVIALMHNSNKPKLKPLEL